MGLRSPVYDLQSARGASFEQHYSFEIARDYGNPQKEYEILRFSAGVINLSHLGMLRATGPDRVRYLHSMLSNDINGLRPGEGCYAALLTNQGRMESDLHAFSFDGEILMECPIAGKDRILAALRKYLVADIVELQDYSERIGILSIQGPNSKERIEEYAGTELDLAPLEHRAIQRPAGKLVVVHRDRSGCGGYDLWLPRDGFRDSWKELTGSREIPPVGNEALNRLRTEAGIPLFGIDMETRHLPLEFGLKNAVSLNKGCYRGQEIMARVTYRGHLNRGFGGIAIEGDRIPPHGAEIVADGSKIGEVSSAAFSPRLDSPLALAVIKQDFLRPGTPVQISVDGSLISGKIVALPLDPKPEN